jgi:hypothetical protein
MHTGTVGGDKNYLSYYLGYGVVCSLPYVQPGARGVF